MTPLTTKSTYCVWVLCFENHITMEIYECLKVGVVVIFRKILKIFKHGKTTIFPLLQVFSSFFFEKNC